MGNAARKPAVCPACGGQCEDPSRDAGLCYGCHLDALVPDGYEDAEAYEAVTLGVGKPGKVAVYWRARRRPPTGVAILDDPPPVRVAEIVLRAGHAAIVRRGEVERQQGV